MSTNKHGLLICKDKVKILHVEEYRKRNREEQIEASLKQKQMSAIEQMKGVICTEWEDKWARVGITEEDLK